MPPSLGDRTGDLYYNSEKNFDSNMVIILAALLCALICALGLNSIVRCAMRCSNRFNSPETLEEAGPHLAANSTGLKKRAFTGQIPEVTYKAGLISILVTDCPICLGEFADGEKVRVLPKCNHGFHVKCIDKWLWSHTSCPLCRQQLLDESASSGTYADEENVTVQLPGTNNNGAGG